MIIHSVTIKNYRSILCETVKCDDLTILVGANGTGKSAFIRGLDLFYSQSPRIDLEDFYNGNVGNEISISVTYKLLNDEEKEKFKKYVQDNKLTVERVFKYDGKKINNTYHGSTLVCPSFKEIREKFEVKDRGEGAKIELSKLKEIEDFKELPNWTKIDDVKANLKTWEESHPDKCIRSRDEGQFFGFQEVATGYLGKYTRFLLIPAIRDASEDTIEKQGSVLTSLMDLVVRSVISKKDEIKKFEEKTEKEYQETYDPTKLKELSTLQERLTATLKIYVPNANINLTWRPLSKINIPLPQADIKLIEDDYPVPVSKTGHGLQRAFILTLLQHLSLAQISTKKGDAESKGEAEEASLPNLVLAIEEPELYQHPSRQRHFSNVLLQLATGKIPGVAEKTQILYTTHSPLFVGIDRINQIRLFRKIPYEKDKPKVTKVISTNLDVIAEKIWEANGKPGEKYTGDSLIPRLVTIMNPWMNEGFFSDAVVLVEGEDDRAALIGTASYMGYDLETLGYSVIPCSGKTNIDRPATIFRELNIPVYLLWDGDKGDGKAKPEDNHRLLRLLGQPVSDWPCAVEYTYSCFEKNLEETLKNEIGEALFERCLLDCQNEYNIPEKKHALKNPHVITGIIKRASEQDKPSVVLKNIIEKILFLKYPLNQLILSS